MADRTKKRTPRLGRGLSSLMATPVQVQPPPEVFPEAASTPRQASSKAGSVAVAEAPPSVTPEAKPELSSPIPGPSPTHSEGLHYLAIKDIEPNPHQPRQQFDDSSIEHLAASIKADGLMQPIILRPTPGTPGTPAGRQRGDGGGLLRPTPGTPGTPAPGNGDNGSSGSGTPSGGYQIVAGERRWRAALIAGLEHIPVLVRELDDQQAAEWALIENLQREDLNPIDRAEAFQRLSNQFALSHNQIAERVGLERPTISNLLRLLDLSESSRALVRDGLLSMGQARAIAGLSDASVQEALATRAVREGLSVREVEKLVRQHASGNGSAGRPTAKKTRSAPSAHLADLEKQVAEQLGTKVQIRTGRRKGSGKLTIDFYSLDQFDAIMSKLGVNIG